MTPPRPRAPVYRGPRPPFAIALPALIAVLLSACANDCRVVDTGTGFVCGGDQTEAIIDPTFGVPVIEATLGDRPLRLLVDTGTDTTVISSTFLHQKDATAIRLTDPLCIGEGFCFEKIAVYAWDTALTTAGEGRINAILGMDLLRYFTLELRRGQALVLYLKSAPCDESIASTPLLYNEKGAPVASVRVDDTHLDNTLLDTGAAFCLLDNHTSNGVDAYFRDAATETKGCDAFGCNVEGAYLSTLKQLCIEDQCLDAVQTKFPAWNAVGNTYFSAYNLRFDFVASELLFCKDSD